MPHRRNEHRTRANHDARRRSSQTRRPRFTNEAAETPNLPKSLLADRHRKRRDAKDDQAREPTAAGDAEPSQPPRSGHKPDAETSRADDARHRAA